jgi:phage-related protein
MFGRSTMPKTQVVFYQESEGDVPVLDWLKSLMIRDRKGYAKCVTRIQQLTDAGYELRRPAADYLRDDIYELRAKHVNVQYRILYFFQGQNIAILAHAIVKEDAAVPDIDIERAIARKAKLGKDFEYHTYTMEVD